MPRRYSLGLATIIICVLASQGLAQFQISKDASTQETVAAQKLKFLLKDLDAYEKLPGQAEINESVRDFVTRCCEYRVYDFNDDDESRLVDDCATMLRDHGEHPLVLLHSGYMYYQNGYIANAKKTLTKLETVIKDIDGLERVKLNCLQLIYWLEERFTPSDAAKQKQQWGDAMVAFAEKEQDIENQPFLLDAMVSEALGDMDFAERIWESKAHDWLKNMLKGIAHRDRGWEIRGGGYAHKVKEGAWEKFEAELQTATEHYERAWKIDKSLPHAASRMIGISMADNEHGTPREWFMRTISAQADFSAAYNGYFWSLRPRWDGSLEEILELGNECYETRQFETEIPVQLLWAMRAVADESEGYSESLFDEDVIDNALNALDRCASELEKKRCARTRIPPNQLRSAAYNLAMDVGRTNQAKELAEEIFDDYDKEFSRKLDLSYRTIRNIDEELGLTKEYKEKSADLIITGEEPREERAKKRQQMMELQQEFADQSENRFTRRLLAQFAVETGQIAAYEQLGWVPIPFGDVDYGWYWGNGIWRSIDNDSVEMAKGWYANGSHIYSFTPFYSPCEVEVEIEFGDSYGPDPRVGLFVGFLPPVRPNELPEEEPTARCFWINPEKGTAGANYALNRSLVYPIEKKQKYKLRVKAWEGVYVVYIDDQVVFQRAEKSFKPDGYIGVGGLSYIYNSLEAKFSNLRVRWMTHDVPPTGNGSKPKEQIAYFDKVLQQDPSDDWALTMRGLAHFAAGDYELSLKDLESSTQPIDEGKRQHLYLGRSYAKLGRFKEAAETFEKSIAKAKSKTNYNNLAWFFATCPENECRDGKRAVELARKAVAFDEQDPGTLDTLAAAFAETGDFESAIKWQEKAIAELGDDADASPYEAHLKSFKASKPIRSDD